MRGVVAVFVVLAVACGGDDDAAPPDAGLDAAAPDATPATATAVFEPPAAGAGAPWGAVPFPSDLFLDGDGRVTLETIPSGPGADPDFVDMIIEALHEMRGAGVWTNVYFPIEGAIDKTTLDGNVKLVDLDNGLAEIAVDLRWRSDLGTIIAAPQLGIALRQNHRYAAYVTDGVRAGDGGRLGPSSVFAAVRDGGPFTGPEAQHADAVLSPLFDALSDAERESLVTATVFTTDDVTGQMKAMRDIAAATPPTVAVLEVRTDLDTIFGVAPADTPPGYSYLMKRPQPHSNIAAVIQATIELPTFSTDTPGTDGIIELDGTGQPIVKSTDTVTFTITLPTAASYADLPAMIYVPSFGGTRIDSLLSADIAAAHGMATIGMEIAYHGSRAASVVDDINWITGEVGADGFGDQQTVVSVVRFLHLGPNGGFPGMHPGAITANAQQAAVDLISVVSYVADGDVGPLNTALASAGLPSDLSFRSGGVAIAGESVGGMWTILAATLDDRIDAIVLNGSPGGVPYPALLHSALFSGQISELMLGPLGVRERMVYGDQDLDARFDPMVVMWSNVLQRADAISYAPYLLSGELRADDGPSVLYNEAWADEVSPNIGNEHLAGAIGLPRMLIDLPEAPPAPAMRYVSLPEVTAPVSANIDAARTAALVLWHPASHVMGYWYEDYYEFEHEFPPFVPLPELDGFINYTPELQEVRALFFDDYYAGRAPTAVDPFQ